MCSGITAARKRDSLGQSEPLFSAVMGPFIITRSQGAQKSHHIIWIRVLIWISTELEKRKNRQPKSKKIEKFRKKSDNAAYWKRRRCRQCSQQLKQGSKKKLLEQLFDPVRDLRISNKTGKDLLKNFLVQKSFEPFLKERKAEIRQEKAPKNRSNCRFRGRNRVLKGFLPFYNEIDILSGQNFEKWLKTEKDQQIFFAVRKY